MSALLSVWGGESSHTRLPKVKRVEAAHEGSDVAIEETPGLKCCMVCKVVSPNLMSCEKCSCGCYCSVECMSRHENHTTYCPVICSVEKHETEKRIATEIFSMDAEKLPYRMNK